MQNTVLILGGNGRFGRHASDAFAAKGWEVRQFDRGSDNLWDAAWGAEVIVNAWNPPYTEWAAQIPKLTAQVIEVASATKATVIIPGNVYVYGQDAADRFTAQTPHNARNPLGRIRIEMEAAYRSSGVRTIILRAGDFLDNQASGNWFDKIITAGLGKGRFTYPGNPDIPHAWAWLPDLARAAADLAQMSDDLPHFADIPFAGYTLTGSELCAAVANAIDQPLTLKKMAWLPLHIAGPFWPMGRKLLEMRYLWDKPHRLEGEKLDALLPGFQTAPLEEVLHMALISDSNVAGRAHIPQMRTAAQPRG